MTNKPHDSRRQFLKTALALAPGLLLPHSGFAAADNGLGADRIAPHLDQSQIIRFVAGLRPFRQNGIRLARETRFGKTMIHNYGHGGGGFTLAWGSAEAAFALMPPLPMGADVAVLGGGVIGLTTAFWLAERGYRVTIYAAQWSPHTTSNLAGAQWSPSHVGPGSTPHEQARYQQILETSFKSYHRFEGPRFGVFMKDNFIPDGAVDPLQKIHVRAMPAYQRLTRMPFAGSRAGGFLYRSWLIEPSVFLPELMNTLRAMGVQFKTQRFQRDNEDFTLSSGVSDLGEAVVFNCMGLGSGRLVPDTGLKPIRGRLIHLKPDDRVDYLLLQKGYLFARRDLIVIGGTFDEGISDLSLDTRPYNLILAYQRSFFGLPKQTITRTDIPYHPIRD